MTRPVSSAPQSVCHLAAPEELLAVVLDNAVGACSRKRISGGGCCVRSEYDREWRVPQSTSVEDMMASEIKERAES
jgi:hypothetical protein